MSDLILKTKLYPPPVNPDIFPREELIRRLSSDPGKKFILVSASAGFGKSSLISLWLERTGMPFAWYSLDKRDNDPLLFLSYLINSLQSIDSTVCREIQELIESREPPPVEVMLGNLINSCAMISTPYYLVIDDFHAITSETVKDILNRIIGNMPPSMGLVVVTRETPDLKLARLRSSGRMLELGTADLRFSEEETRDWFNDPGQPPLPRALKEVIAVKSEGWVTAMKLMMITVKGGTPGSLGELDRIEHTHIVEYLIQEVLEHLPPPVEEFLFATSLVDSFSPLLCAELIPESPLPAGEIIETLNKLNLFIIPLDNQKSWFRYHYLFRNALTKLLPQEYQPGSDTNRTLHRRAALWYESNRYYLEAIEHFCQAEEYHSVQTLLAKDEIPLLSSRMIDAILEILRPLPRVILEKHPALYITIATLTLSLGKNDRVGEYLDIAENTLSDRDRTEEDRDMLGRIAAARATLSFSQYRLDRILSHSERALSLLKPDNLLSRATALWTRANAWEQLGNVGLAKQDYALARSLSERADNHFFILLCLLGQGRTEEWENNLLGAEKLYQDALRLFPGHGQPVFSEVYMGLGRLCYQWDELDRAEEFAREALRLARFYGENIDRYILSELFLAQIELSRGNIYKTESMLSETGKNIRRHGFKSREKDLLWLRVKALLKQDLVAEASRMAENSTIRKMQITLNLAMGDAETALSGLSDLMDEAVTRGWKSEMTELSLMKAQALRIQGETHGAREIMERTLIETETQGHIRLYIDQGKPIQDLIEDLGKGNFLEGYCRTLLGSFGKKTGDMEEPLTPRELEILRLISEGYSNLQIGERLFLALDTIKGHNRNIFGKLKVNRRTEAVARARALGLLKPL